MRKKVFTTKHLTTIDNRNTTDKKLLLSDKKCQVANFEFPLEKKRGKNTNSWAKVQLKNSTVGNNIVVFYCYLCHVK